MRLITAIFLFVLLIPTAGWSQADEVVQVYAFYAPGVRTSTLGSPSETTVQFGFGGDFSLSDRLRLGGEVGYVGRHENVFNSGLGVLSGNVSYLIGSNETWTPFVTVGYTRFFNLLAGANGMNLGGGTHIQLWKKLGLRVEFRDQIGWGNRQTQHFLGVRFGPVFTFN